MNIVKGNITHEGPIKSAHKLEGFDLLYVTPGMLPMAVSVDMDSLSPGDIWVLITSRQFKYTDGKMYDGWCELPRFTPDAIPPEPPTPPTTGKKYKFTGTFTGTIEEE